MDKWTPIFRDPGAVNFHHENSIVPANSPWVSEDGGPHSQYQNLLIIASSESLAFSIDTAGMEFKLLRR